MGEKKKKKQGKKKINRNVSHFFKRGHKFSVKIILAKPQREMSEGGGWRTGGWRAGGGFKEKIAD